MSDLAAADARNTITIAEWETLHLPTIRLTDGDRRWLERLRPRLDIEELRAGIRITASGFVGTVQLPSITVHVTPKMVGGTLDVARLIGATRGLASIQRQLGRQRLDTDRDRSLVDLLTLLLAEATERTLRGGLVSDYIERDEPLSVVRGRLLVDRQLLSEFGQVHRLWCRFDELEQDTDENRLLCVALRAAARATKDSGVLRRLRYLEGIFNEVCTVDSLELETLKGRLCYNRQNSHYQEAHNLAWLILDSLGVSDVSGLRGDTNSFAFLVDMARVFEDWIGVVSRKCFPSEDFQVTTQDSSGLTLRDGSTGGVISRPRPDVVVRRRGTLTACAIDAKYKQIFLGNVSSADLYQCFTYASLLSTAAQLQVRRSVLVYPAVKRDFEHRVVQFPRVDGTAVAEVVILGLPVPRCLEPPTAELAHPIDSFSALISSAL